MNLEQKKNYVLRRHFKDTILDFIIDFFRSCDSSLYIGTGRA